ncbi:Hypothetical protein HEAR0696 [Herminiimonas arsenicoxydans]|uniref:Uncharacterized protein n=1 Tax=Herminiimonas arsenicoxydans TaxID=204773 RepID=A4G303_HERAR|nr:Hypothetical protein HEAR0696 [Herminiimonas arsenicoxydans]
MDKHIKLCEVDIGTKPPVALKPACTDIRSLAYQCNDPQRHIHPQTIADAAIPNTRRPLNIQLA